MADAFSRIVTGEDFKVNHKVYFKDKYLAHLAVCQNLKKKYAGQTALDHTGNKEKRKQLPKTTVFQKIVFSNRES